MRIPNSIPALLIMIASPAVSAAVVFEHPQPKSYGSPQEVFTAFRKASARKDYLTLLGCLTGDDVDLIAAGLIRGVGMTKNMDASLGLKLPTDRQAEMKRVDEVLRKHGLTDELVMGAGKTTTLPSSRNGVDPRLSWARQTVAPVKDRAAFVVELIPVLGMDQMKQTEGFALGQWSIQTVTTSSGTAKASIIGRVDGKRVTDRLSFRKVNGSWKIQLFVESGRVVR